MTILEELTRNANRVFYFDEGPKATTRLVSKAYPRAEKSQKTLARKHWRPGRDPVAPRRAARPQEPRQIANPRLLELQVVKQILEEIFHGPGPRTWRR